MKNYYILTAISMAVLIVACVPARQYQDMEKSKRSYQYQNDTLRAYVKNIVSLTAAERDEFAKLKRDNKSLNEDILKEKERYARLDETNQDILNRYDRLLNQMKELNGNNNNTGGGGATNSVIVLRERSTKPNCATCKATNRIYRGNYRHENNVSQNSKLPSKCKKVWWIMPSLKLKTICKPTLRVAT